MINVIIRKVFLQILGLILIAFGVSAIILTKLGSGTADAFCTFFTFLIGLEIKDVGTINLALNSTIAVIIFFMTGNKKIFLSMIAGIILGVFINFAVIIYGIIFPVLESGKTILENIFFGVFMNFISIILIGMGAAILFTQNLIMVPYDELAKFLSIKFKSFKTSKIILDTFFLINAIILGLIVGRLFEQINVFTIITVYAFGASSGFFIKLFNKKMLNQSNG